MPRVGEKGRLENRHRREQDRLCFTSHQVHDRVAVDDFHVRHGHRRGVACIDRLNDKEQRFELVFQNRARCRLEHMQREFGWARGIRIGLNVRSFFVGVICGGYHSSLVWYQATERMESTAHSVWTHRRQQQQSVGGRGDRVQRQVQLVNLCCLLAGRRCSAAVRLPDRADQAGQHRPHLCGEPSVFLDAVFAATRNGWLLLVTCTDMV